MDVSIGLPNAVPGTTGKQLVDWAKESEARGFKTLGTIDRVAYGNHEPLTALAAAAAVTERIGLLTSVLLLPLRTNATLLAKQAQSVHAISGGRLTLGVAVGGRPDDYSESDVSFDDRGQRMDAALERVREVWESDLIGPNGAGSPSLIVGGNVGAAFRRAAQFGDGWIAGGSGPEEFAQLAEKARGAWSEAGKDGAPRLMALGYFGLGDGAQEKVDAYIQDYYAFLGEETAGYIAGAAATDPETVQQYLSAYEGAGCDELVLFPVTAEVEQVGLLAEAAGL
jgi:alkanesulfonate monooxygenase SsuD/methylene tetrahydromethanopterin reductase-like flavin-dependent oxidoreductase (luciferase family)